MKTRPIILFDIDYTLIDTNKLKKLINQELGRLLNLKPKTMTELVKEYSLGLKKTIEFSPESLISFLEEKFPDRFPQERLRDLFFKNELFYQRSLYPQTKSVLKKLSHNYQLGIFSEGHREFQLTKLKLSGLWNYFKKELVFIYDDKSNQAENLVQTLGRVYIVDDRRQHILAYQKTKGVIPIWLQRSPESKANQEVGLLLIFSLLELEEKLIQT